MAVLHRGDFDAARLRGLARKTTDGPQTRRLVALEAIYDGKSEVLVDDQCDESRAGGDGCSLGRARSDY